MESQISQNLYKLNKDYLLCRNECIRKKSNSINIHNFKILCSHLRNNAFQRIIAKLKKLKSKDMTGLNYELKEYEKFPKCKVVVYTCIWGEYDEVLEPYYVNDMINYYIITDMDIPKNSIWKKYDLSNITNINGMTDVEVNRYFKMLPHKLFPDFDYSIYIDGNIRIITDMLPIIADIGDNIIGIHDYPIDCIYNMKDAIIAGKRAAKKNVIQQIKKYQDIGFPEHFGAFECNVLVRKHNDIKCVEIMNDWWDEFNSTSSKRDQLSLPVVLWRHNLSSSFVFSLGKSVRDNPRFQVGISHKK